jgi:hypothetical protein
MIVEMEHNTDLELINLPLLIPPKLVHVLLQLLTFRLCLLLLVLRGFDSIREILDVLFGVGDLGCDLARRNG